MSGEVNPRSPRRSAWFSQIYQICEIALEQGFLPHTNVGLLSVAEMAELKKVNVSMGLMLEQLTPALQQGVHRHAPSKHPELRLAQLEQAGRLGLPFTTGLLLGIGETPWDRLATLEAIAQCHKSWGHIQEVILQPHQPGASQVEGRHPFDSQMLIDFVQVARQVLPADITLQIPPNLVADEASLLAAIASGARDLGGLGPLDEVNPDYAHPHPAQLRTVLNKAGWQLQPRLPLYPHYDDWLDPSLRVAVELWRNRLNSAVIST